MTGAGGFLGRTLTQALFKGQEEPLHLYLLGRSPLKEGDGLSWVSGDITEDLAETLTRHLGKNQGKINAIEDLDGIFHLAAQVSHSRKADPQIYRVNVEGTLNVIRLAAKARCRVIFVSTSGVVGCSQDSSFRPDEDAPYAESLIRRWPYYHSKMIAEQQARRLARELGVELVIVRPPVLLGPGDSLGRSTQVLRKLRDGELPVALKGGYHFVDVRDVAEALKALMFLKSVRSFYHLPGYSSSLRNFFSMAAEVARVHPPRWCLSAKSLKWVKHALPRRWKGKIPDPVLLEMGECHWGLSSKYSAKELGYRSRSAVRTLEDTLAEW